MTDVRIYQTADGGEINVENGIAEMDDGRYSMVYLALFGGNSDDPGGDDKSRSWWGNTLEPDPVKQYRSRTQYLLQAFPATTGNLNRVTNAVAADLQPLVDAGELAEPTISVSIPRVNWVYIKIESSVGVLEYIQPWEGPA